VTDDDNPPPPKRRKVEFQGAFQLKSQYSRYLEAGIVPSYGDWDTGWTIGSRDSIYGKETALEPTQSLIQWVLVADSPRVK
jgi:hypothetical protein